MWIDQKRKRLEKQLNIHENRLQALTDDYEALSNQIGFETNEQNKNVIRRRIALVQKEIDAAEGQQRTIYAELQSLIATTPETADIHTKQKSAVGRRNNSRVSRTVLQPKPKLNIRQPPLSSASKNKAWIWQTALYVVLAVVLVIQWQVIKDIAIAFIASNLDDIPDRSISAYLSRFGGVGGALTGAWLYLSISLQHYFKQRRFSFSLVSLIVYLTVAIATGSLLWYVPETLLYDGGEGDPMQYTSGAKDSANFCIILSLLFLWFLPRLKSRISSTR